MHCPACQHEETKVVDSRLSTDGLTIRRRRECEKCEYRFSTLEQAEILDLMVVKRDGRRIPYDREKLERGLRKSLEKRPCEPATFRSLVAAIERDIHASRFDEMTSRQIGEIVMRHLRGFDQVAYIRFASVYREFQDVKDFQDELKKMG